MSQTINVLFLAAEAEPFVKVGGLGDVAGTLPRALRALSTDDLKIDVRLVLPMHSVIKAELLKPVGIYSIPRGSTEVQVEAFEGVLDGMPVYFINGEPIRPAALFIHPITNSMRRSMSSSRWPRSNCRASSIGIQTSFMRMTGTLRSRYMATL